MAERKSSPVAKKAVTTKTAGKAAAKPAKAAAPAASKKVAAKKTAAKPKTVSAPAAKKMSVPAAAKKAPVKKTATVLASPSVRKAIPQPTPEERYRMVQTAAYFIAERNGFCGCPTEYWAAAEIEIGNMLGQ